ncbi:MAG: T9SS type A sorting domain-containing protein [Chitinophagaceae bacterium]|nr:T9SS type A sorting domain-containing protein [Chitinophagaceae bacterium]
MNRFLLLCLLASVTFCAKAQIYKTTKSGNSGATGTWVGGQKPPPTCNCQIIIQTGHTLTVNESLNLVGANFVIQGTGSLTFNNSGSITLTGSSSFDIQSTQATIAYNSSTTPFIKLSGTEIYRGNTTRFPVTEPLGTVRGTASATSANPVWSNATLPVSLANFKVAGKDGKANLSWSTDLEVNSSHFEIERSSDSRAWTKIGSVNAAGNTGVTQNYSFTDNSPLTGNNYYRLKIVDIDAKYEYSPIKSVNVSAGIAITAGPNPAYSVLNVMVTQEVTKDFQVKVINNSGQTVFTRKYAGTLTKVAVDVSKFPEGNYFVEVSDGAGAKTIKNILVLRK